MVEESQSWPLAAARLYRRSDEENPTLKAIRKERSNKCFIYVFSGIVILSIILLVLSLLFLRPKSPNLNLISIRVKNLKYSNSPLLPSLNASLVALLKIKNPNFGDFKFDPSTGCFLYGSVKIAEAKIGKGVLNFRGTKILNMNFEVRSNKLTNSYSLRSDINYGMLKLTGYAKIKGKLHFLKIIKTTRTRDMICTMNLILRSKIIKDLQCK